MHIDELLKDYVPKHSEFQIDHFIVGGQGDNWAQYKQALREIKTRYEMVIQLKEELLLESLNGNGKRFFKFGKHAKAKAKIEVARVARKHEAMLENLEHTERELNQFVEIASNLKDRLGEIDSNERKRLEADSWFQKARKLAGLDMVTNGGRLSRATAEFIFSLPKKDQRLLLSEVIGQKEPFKLLGL